MRKISTLLLVVLSAFLSLSSCSSDDSSNTPYIKFIVNGKPVSGSNIRYEYTDDKGQYLVFTSEDINFRLLAPEPFTGLWSDIVYLEYSDTSIPLYYEGVSFKDGSWIEITEHDWETYKMSGRFNFHAYDEETDTHIDITNGEFFNVITDGIPANHN